jgi:DNA-binding MarR family transcriptional regulator
MPDAPVADAPDAFDPLVVNPGRLSILTALVGDAGGAEFVQVRRVTRLTDGNLASHAKRLADGGLIDIAKAFRDGKPVTSYVLTPAGRSALTAHVRRVTAAVTGGHAAAAGEVRRVVPSSQPKSVQPVQLPASDDDGDWVD